jgi:hypothetical protein
MLMNAPKSTMRSTRPRYTLPISASAAISITRFTAASFAAASAAFSPSAMSIVGCVPHGVAYRTAS